MGGQWWLLSLSLLLLEILVLVVHGLLLLAIVCLFVLDRLTDCEFLEVGGWTAKDVLWLLCCYLLSAIQPSKCGVVWCGVW